MWKKVTREHFRNQELIFPAAQESVLQIIKNAIKIDDIKKITVFGSCVESRFSPVSDIDIFVDQDSKEHYLLASGLLRGVDYWTKQSVDISLMNEILKKGVVVYEYGDVIR